MKTQRERKRPKINFQSVGNEGRIGREWEVRFRGIDPQIDFTKQLLCCAWRVCVHYFGIYVRQKKKTKKEENVINESVENNLCFA